MFGPSSIYRNGADIFSRMLSSPLLCCSSLRVQLHIPAALHSIRLQCGLNLSLPRRCERWRSIVPTYNGCPVFLSFEIGSMSLRRMLFVRWIVPRRTGCDKPCHEEQRLHLVSYWCNWDWCLREVVRRQELFYAPMRSAVLAILPNMVTGLVY